MEDMEKRIASAVAGILENQRLGRQIDRTDHRGHPDREMVIHILTRLMGVLFPGCRQEKAPCLRTLIEDLKNQIALVLPDATENRAWELSLAFFERIPQLRDMLQEDVEAAWEGDPAAAGMDEIIFCYPGIYATGVYRLAHELYTLQVPMIPRIIGEYAHGITGIDIHPGARVGRRFFIDHGTGIVIGETAVIGENVKIYQGVTLGGLSTRGGQSLRGKKRHPTVGDRVTIYANASILGGDTVIGRDCVIGASAFITSSVPPCTTVTTREQELLYRARSCEGCPKAAEPFREGQR